MTEACRIQAGLTPEEMEFLGDAADIEQTLHLIDEEKAKIFAAKRQRKLQIVVTTEIATYMKNHPGGMNAALKDRMSVPGDQAGVVSLESHQQAIYRMAVAKIGPMINDFAPKVAGFFGNKSMTKMVVRELFGETTGNADAIRYSEIWGETTDALLERFNRAGGRIVRRQDWALPQTHDAGAINKAGFDAWLNHIVPRLDIAKTTQALEITPDQLTKSLKRIWATLATEGVDPGQLSMDDILKFKRGKKIANTRLDHRYLHFKNGDSWLEYQTEFGKPDTLFTMLNHLERMSNDIGAMEVLGPNPQATVDPNGRGIGHGAGVA